jgi:hypothetical protein
MQVSATKAADFALRFAFERLIYRCGRRDADESLAVAFKFGSGHADHQKPIPQADDGTGFDLGFRPEIQRPDRGQLGLGIVFAVVERFGKVRSVSA